MSNNWSTPTSHDEAARRAAGRKRYNAWRTHIVQLRRLEVARLLTTRYPPEQRGTVQAIAKALRVHPSTVCRDVQAILREHNRCPHCGQLPPLGGGMDAGPTMIEQVLEECRAEFALGTWQWVGRGPLPRNGAAQDAQGKAG